MFGTSLAMLKPVFSSSFSHKNLVNISQFPQRHNHDLTTYHPWLATPLTLHTFINKQWIKKEIKNLIFTYRIPYRWGISWNRAPHSSNHSRTPSVRTWRSNQTNNNNKTDADEKYSNISDRVLPPIKPAVTSDDALVYWNQRKKEKIAHVAIFLYRL